MLKQIGLTPRPLGGGEGAADAGTDPLTLVGLEQYLRSDGVDTAAVAVGNPIAGLTDLSGNGRHMIPGAVAANTPVVSTDAAPSGAKLIRFDGAVDPNGDFMERNIGLANFPDNIFGYTFYFVGRFFVPVAPDSVIWADETYGRPQLIMQEFGTNKMGWRDTGSTQVGGSFADTGFTSLEWAFQLPFGSVAKVWRSSVLQHSGAWTWNSFLAGGKEFLGMGQLVRPTKMDLGAFAWFSRGHDDATVLAVRTFLKASLGA